MTWSGWPGKRWRRSSRWVATPTGQVFSWHCRAITQPAVTSDAVPNTYSLGAERGGDRHVAPGLEPAVGRHADAVPEAGRAEHLVRLRKPELPRKPSVLDRCLR